MLKVQSSKLNSVKRNIVQRLEWLLDAVDELIVKLDIGTNYANLIITYINYVKACENGIYLYRLINIIKQEVNSDRFVTTINKLYLKEKPKSSMLSISLESFKYTINEVNKTFDRCLGEIKPERDDLLSELSKDINSENNYLSTENDSLNKKNNTLTDENMKLSMRIEDLKQDHDKLKQGYDKLKQGYDKLKQDHNKLKQDHNKLKQDHNKFKQDYDKLEQDHNELKRNYDDLGHDYDDLDHDYDDLYQEYVNNAQDYNKLVRDHNKLIDENKSLKETQSAKGYSIINIEENLETSKDGKQNFNLLSDIQQLNNEKSNLIADIRKLNNKKSILKIEVNKLESEINITRDPITEDEFNILMEAEQTHTNYGIIILSFLNYSYVFKGNKGLIKALQTVKNLFDRFPELRIWFDDYLINTYTSEELRNTSWWGKLLNILTNHKSQTPE